MKLEKIKALGHRYEGGLKGLAIDAGMNEQGLHRCLSSGKMWAHNLENIARALEVPITVFFDEDVCVMEHVENNEAHTEGNSSPALGCGELNQTNISTGDNSTVSYGEKAKYREKESLRKDELIRSLKREVSDLRRTINDKDYIISLLSGKPMPGQA